jgi:hypothetical protein
MMIEKMTIEQWRREAPELRAKSERVLERFKPARRQKPRHPAERSFCAVSERPSVLSGLPQASLGEASPRVQPEATSSDAPAYMCAGVSLTALPTSFGS